MAIHCPKCGSTEITTRQKGVSVKNGLIGAFLIGPLGALFGAKGRNETIIVCLNCGKEFVPGEGDTDEDIERKEKKKQESIQRKEERKKSLWFSWLMVILFFPYGLYLMYKNGYKKSLYWGIAYAVIMSIFVNFSDHKRHNTNISSSKKVESSVPIQKVSEKVIYNAMDIAKENAANFKEAWNAGNKYEQDGGKDLATVKNIFEGIRNQFIKKYDGKMIDITGKILEKKALTDAYETDIKWNTFVLGKTIVDVPVVKGTRQAMSEVVALFDNKYENYYASKKRQGDTVKVRGNVKIMYSLNGDLSCYIEGAKIVKSDGKTMTKNAKGQSILYKLFN